jgi:chemotaxis protein CheZ
MSKTVKDNQGVMKELEALESSGAEMVPMSQVRTLIGVVRDFFDGNLDPSEVQLYGELGELAKFINGARKELRDFQPGLLKDEKIPEASDQLDAIVKTTEAATGQIMDACERLDSAHQQIRDRLMSANPPIDPDVIAGVEDSLLETQTHITSIYEACNFQDLTGQRIQKITTALREVERQVMRMVIVFGLRKDNKMDEETKKRFEGDAALLNGPQLPGTGMEQDEIDAILAKLL